MNKYTVPKSLFTLCFCLAVLGCEEEQVVTQIRSPELVVNSPLDFGNVPVGSQQTGKLIITNGGDAPLVIDEIQMDAVNPAFQISLKELPVTITARQALELVIVFTPTSDGPYQTELNFVSNHSGDDLEPVVLKGNGEQDTVCRSCEPPPGPECAQNGDLSLTFTANTTTSCESESGECGYTIIETPCEWGPCIEETGLCPEIGDTNDPNEQVICGDGVLSETEECDDGNILVENCPYGEGACEVCGENCTMVTGLIQFCGDNQLQEDEEECDNGMIGNSNEAADACRTNCKLPSCGDGVTDTNEVCDDGNGLNFDGCSSACVVEDGWDCTGPICVPICGDNLVVGNEQCDDGNLETEYCEYAATYCVVCNHECMYGPGLLQSCGDGIMQAGEECDNGDSNNDYAPNACRENCKIAGCGDGVIDLNESCDDDNSENNDGCSDACLIEEGWECIGQPSACETICGDLIIAGNEECDNGLSGDFNCDYDVMSCEVCGEDCTLVDGQLVYCGDGVLQEDYEECDNGTMDAVDDSPGVYNSDSMDDACRTNCKEAHCGDGVIDSNEVCDDLNDLDGDGCSSACVVEDGWECFNEPSECERIGLEPPGEDCYNASPIFSESGEVTEHYGATDDYNLPSANSCTGWPTDGPDVYYSVRLEPGETFQATVKAFAPGGYFFYDVSIYLLRSCPATSFGCIAGADDEIFSPPEETLTFTWPASQSLGHTFYFGIDTYCNNEFTCPTADDLFTLTWSIE